MSRHIRIDHRYNGPPDSGHGGYTCGTVAAHVDTKVGTPGALDNAAGVVTLTPRTAPAR